MGLDSTRLAAPVVALALSLTMIVHGLGLAPNLGSIHHVQLLPVIVILAAPALALAAQQYLRAKRAQTSCFQLALLRGLSQGYAERRLSEFARYLQDISRHGISVEYRIEAGKPYALLNLSTGSLEKLVLAEKGLQLFRDIFEIRKCSSRVCATLYTTDNDLSSKITAHTEPDDNILVVDWKGFAKNKLNTTVDILDLSNTVRVEDKIKILIEEARKRKPRKIIIIDPLELTNTPTLHKFEQQLAVLKEAQAILLLPADDAKQHNLQVCHRSPREKQ